MEDRNQEQPELRVSRNDSKVRTLHNFIIHCIVTVCLLID